MTDTHELLYALNDKVDAIIDLLLSKNIITEEELSACLDEEVEEEEEEDSDEPADEDNDWNDDWQYDEDKKEKVEEDPMQEDLDIPGP